VLRDVSFALREGEISALIGPNGAGKTTLFNVITGVFPANSGKILFDGHDITRLKPHRIMNLGIRRSFQGAKTFQDLSVFDNVYYSYHMSYKTSIIERILRLPSALKEENLFKEKAMEILDYVGLIPHKDKLARGLSSGLLRLLAIANTLTTDPKLLLLDEPVTTLSPDKVTMVMDLIMKIRASGTTVLIIEHNMRAIMNYCDRIVVLGYGKKLAEGTAREVQNNPIVVESYLGVTQ
jgi:branched-chain amino acid transport system ATP-binding protein